MGKVVAGKGEMGSPALPPGSALGAEHQVKPVNRLLPSLLTSLPPDARAGIETAVTVSAAPTKVG